MTDLEKEKLPGDYQRLDPDLVKVVRCKDCEKGVKRTDIIRCYWQGVTMPLDGYCSYGRKKGSA